MLEGGVYRVKDAAKFRAMSEVMHHRLLTTFNARPERLQQSAAARPGEEKKAPTDEPRDTDPQNDTSAAAEKEIEQPPAQQAVEPPALRRSPRKNRGRFMKDAIVRIYATVATVRRVKENICHGGRGSRPENQAALSLLLCHEGGGV